MKDIERVCIHSRFIDGERCCTRGWSGVETWNKKLGLDLSSFPSGIQLKFVDRRFIAGHMENFNQWLCKDNHSDCTHHEFEERKPV